MKVYRLLTNSCLARGLKTIYCDSERARNMYQVIDGLHLGRLERDLSDFGAGAGNGSVDLDLDHLAFDDLGLLSNPDADALPDQRNRP